MLRHLNVRDFALVHEIDLVFEAGLTVLTGESGAGKTILLEALGLVLGDRANTASIRPGASRSDIVAEFALDSNEPARHWLEAHGLEDAENPATCLLRRTVARDGRSRAFVNGTPVNVVDLAELATTLIDIHDQNEHQQLLRRSVQLELLDHYAGNTAPLVEVRDAFHDWHNRAREVETLIARAESGRDRRALLQYQVAELDELDPREGEYETLDAQFRRLAKAQEIAQVLAEASASLSGESSGDSAAEAQTPARLLRALEAIDDRHPRLDSARDLLRTAQGLLDEAAAELRHYEEAIVADPEHLSRIEQRLGRLLDLARKHRLRPEALAAHVGELHRELASLSIDDGDLLAMRRDVDARAARYRTLATALSKRRRKVTKTFEGAVGRHMRELGIKGGALALAFEDTETETGIDAVEYRIVTNPSFPAAPLAQIASGGERSRISLAIQVVAADKVRLPALILDEADVGIGGVTADVVGRLLQRLAQHTQVLCVTHAPQVAARGTHHLRVGKSAKGETFIDVLADESRIAELARMLGGREITAKTLEYAEELINAGTA